MQSQRDAYALLKKHYEPPDYKVRAYNALRLSVLPMAWLSQLMKPLEGSVLCLGCGFGTLETVLAADNPQLSFVASDFNERRIRAASSSVRGLDNIRFDVADATSVRAEGSYDNVFFSDLLHHLDAGEQEPLLDKMWALVRPGGALVFKDVDTTPRWKYHWNHAHDRAMAGLPLTYLPKEHYADHLRAAGAEVIVDVAKTRQPYAHYAVTARRR